MILLQDFLFDDIINAPLEDKFKRVKSVDERTSLGRKISNFASNFTSKLKAKTKPVDRRTFSDRLRNSFFLDDNTRDISSELESRYALANIAMQHAEQGGSIDIRPASHKPRSSSFQDISPTPETSILDGSEGVGDDGGLTRRNQLLGPRSLSRVLPVKSFATRSDVEAQIETDGLSMDMVEVKLWEYLESIESEEERRQLAAEWG